MAHKIILDFKERRNAKKWKHKEGAKIHKPNGHRAITDNGWIPTKRLKKGTYGLIKKHEGGGPVDKDKYVSDEYINNYPNIIAILGLRSSNPNPQVIGYNGDHAETVPNELARKMFNFNLVDSAMYTPILNRLETYLTNKKEFNPQEEINLKALALGLESVYNELEDNYTEGHKMINSKVDKITDDDITELLNTKDLFHIGLRKAIKLLPENFSAKDILQIIKYASSGGFLRDYSSLSNFGYKVRRNHVEDDPEKWKEFIYKKGGTIHKSLLTKKRKEGGEINNVNKSSDEKPKKKLAIKRLVNPTGFVNKRPVPGMLTRKQKGGIFKYLGGTPEGGIVIAERDNTYVQPFLVSLVMPRYKPEPEPEPVVDNRSEAHKKYLETFYRLGGEDLSSRSNKARTNEANKYTIPYIPEKEIRLTTDRYNTGKISTNLLDSIYNASLRTGVPFDIALGLAGRESTLGIGRGFKRGSAISGTNLYSNWLLILPIIISNKTADKATELFKRIRQGEVLSDEEYNFLTKYFENRQKELDSTKAMKENPIDNALKYYMLGKYNPGDKKHTLMVEEDARILMTDPAIRKWMLEKGMI